MASEKGPFPRGHICKFQPFKDWWKCPGREMAHSRQLSRLALSLSEVGEGDWELYKKESSTEPTHSSSEPGWANSTISINSYQSENKFPQKKVSYFPPQQVDYGQWRTPTDTLLASAPSPSQNLLLLPPPSSRPGQVSGMVLTCEEFQNMFLDGRWWSSIIPRRSYWQH